MQYRWKYYSGGVTSTSRWWNVDELPDEPDELDKAAAAMFEAADNWIGLPAHNPIDKPAVVSIAFEDGSTLEYRRRS